MLGAVLILAQATATPPSPLPAAGPVLPKALTVAPACEPSADEIVVCGQTDPDQYRLRPLGPPPNGKPLPPMTIPFGKGTANMHAEQRCLTDSQCAPAVMGTIKLPF